MKQIASVTGATGLIGQYIVKQLLTKGYHVRILSRQPLPKTQGITAIQGSLDDDKNLLALLSGASKVFHCAAELKNIDKMQATNVDGTKRLMKLLTTTKPDYFCHLSSVGVIGHTREKLSDELTPCHPSTPYEISKREAEKCVMAGIPGVNIVMLRPTNVLDDTTHSAITYLTDRSLKDQLKLLIKGRECAHVIHAENVAAAALHLMDHAHTSPECYIVSQDEDPLNTFRGLTTFTKKPFKFALPLFVPYLLRRWRIPGTNMGNIRYKCTETTQHRF